MAMCPGFCPGRGIDEAKHQVGTLKFQNKSIFKTFKISRGVGITGCLERPTEAKTDDRFKCFLMGL